MESSFIKRLFQACSICIPAIAAQYLAMCLVVLDYDFRSWHVVCRILVVIISLLLVGICFVYVLFGGEVKNEIKK